MPSKAAVQTHSEHDSALPGCAEQCLQCPQPHWCGRGKRDSCAALLRAALGTIALDTCLHGPMWAMRPCRALIASISEEYNEGAWADLVGQCEEAGVDGFELNLSCPQGLPERGMGMAIGQDNDKVAVRQPSSHSSMPPFSVSDATPVCCWTASINCDVCSLLEQQAAPSRWTCAADTKCCWCNRLQIAAQRQRRFT